MIRVFFYEVIKIYKQYCNGVLMEDNKISQKFKIEGMTCAACVNIIEEKLSEKDEIININVNLVTEIAEIDK